MPIDSGGKMPVVRVIFLHHSVGGDLLRYGAVRERLERAAPAIDLWDHGYNPPSVRRLARNAAYRLLGRPTVIGPDHWYGLRDGAGRRQPGSFAVPGDNTDPDGLAMIFAQPLTTPPSNTLSALMTFDVIAFKSCFTCLPLRSDEQVARTKGYYRSLRAMMDQHPEKLFIPLTTPPLRASLTTPEEAARTRAIARWMVSPEFHGDTANIAPYDLFDALAVAEGQTDANTLRPAYCLPDASDTHPSAAAGRAIGPDWAAFLARTIERASFLRQTVRAS